MDSMKQFWRGFRKLWKKFHINQILLLVASVAFLAFLAFFAYYASHANIDQLKKGLSQSAVMYDKDGDVASKFSSNASDVVNIKEIPENMLNAIVAIEDHRFYQHHGFDIKGMSSAFFKNILAGHVTAGGSTITQQLTKNALLSSERTYKRKVEELFLAVQIEKKYSKKEILAMYLNQVYYGEGAWGIQKAAHKYFGKDIKEIDLSEAATLAGLVNAPSALDPYNHMDAAVKRRNVVLGQMKKFNMISDNQYNQAIKETLALKDTEADPLQNKYPYYVDAVLKEAMNRYGLGQEELLTRGYRIYTELDQNIQTGLEKTYSNANLFVNNKSETLQSGGVLLDPKTGAVRGVVGGRGEHSFLGLNRGTQIKRSPGSTIKPLAVYTPALEEGYNYSSMLSDEQQTFKGNYSPKNYNGQYQNEVPMYKAVEESINVPAVWLLNKIGIDKGMQSVDDFGISLNQSNRKLGLALGDVEPGVSPLQMAGAYATFANGGVRMDTHFITKIVGPTGNVIAEHEAKKTKVISKSVSDKMTAMLLNVVETGTGKGINVPGYTIAGKSGSTQTSNGSASETRDQWFVGYSPNLVGAVWLGYDSGKNNLSGLSSQGVVPIFNSMMQNTLQYTKAGSFDTKSVNDILAGKNSSQSFTDSAKEFNNRFKDGANKLKEKVQQGTSTWKKAEEKLKDKLNSLFGN